MDKNDSNNYTDTDCGVVYWCLLLLLLLLF
jgi:hypothetical protein